MVRSSSLRSRREALLAFSALLASCAPTSREPRAATTPVATDVDREALERLTDLEARVGGRVGVSVYDSARDLHLGYRSDERFPMCSTFKWVLVAAILARVDAGEERLDRIVPYGEADLLDNSPRTTEHLAERGLSVEALSEAAIVASDNAAANLLLGTVGGPAGLTAWIRERGDATTRLDRSEPALNSAEPGDARDTTTPGAMIGLLREVLLGEAISHDARGRLRHWLIDCETGMSRLRAGLWPGWQVGDKTGTGAHGATCDVAIVWPPHHAPILIAAYAVGSTADQEQRNAALASVGRVVAEWSGASKAEPGPPANQRNDGMFDW